MGFAEWTAVGVAIVTLLFSVIGKLLSDKDKQQASQIADLYSKYEADVLRLTQLQIEIAKAYAPKQEIREMIEDVKKHFDDKFDQLIRLQFDRNKSSDRIDHS